MQLIDLAQQQVVLLQRECTIGCEKYHLLRSIRNERLLYHGCSNYRLAATNRQRADSIALSDNLHTSGLVVAQREWATCREQGGWRVHDKMAS